MTHRLEIRDCTGIVCFLLLMVDGRWPMVDDVVVAGESSNKAVRADLDARGWYEVLAGYFICFLSEIKHKQDCIYKSRSECRRKKRCVNHQSPPIHYPVRFTCIARFLSLAKFQPSYKILLLSFFGSR